MEFASDFGKLQRLMASSIAGLSRRQAILETLSIKAGDQIIDIGCGGGHLLEPLARAVGGQGHIYGLDPSEDQVAQARDRCSEYDNVTLLNSYADEICLEQNSCNSVTSTQAFEYIENIDAALAETTRVLISGGAFVNISILWDYFKFFGAEEKLNKRIHDAFRAHCSHQMLPMELSGKLTRLGYRDIRNKSLAFLVTHRDQNSPAHYTEEIVAFFALNQGMSESDVMDWKSQLAQAEKEGRFGFTSFPVLTNAFLN
jgi:arsenite methyltransferase